MVGIVGAPEGGELAVEVGALIGEFRRTQKINRIGARLGSDIQHLVADLVDRDVPGNPCPLAVHQLHRIAQAAVAMHQFARRRALGAMRSAADRAFPAWLLSDPHPVRHFADHGAADRTMRADVLADGGAGHIGAGRFRLTNTGERKRADGGETSRGQARLAQECTAIDNRRPIDCRCSLRDCCDASGVLLSLSTRLSLPQLG